MFAMPVIGRRVAAVARNCWRLSAACLLLSALPPCPAAMAAPSVLILHSYHADYSWTREVAAGMAEGLAEGEPHLRTQVEYLDVRRHHEPSYRYWLLDYFLQHKLRDDHFDLILLSDDFALQFVLRHRRDMFPGIPVVFCGINDYSPELLQGVQGFTGVEEVPSQRETLELALRLHPHTKRIVVIGSPQEMPSARLRKQLVGVIAALHPSPPVTYWDDQPLERLERELHALPAASLVLLNTGELRNRAGQFVPAAEALQRLHAASAAPIYSFWDYYLGQGIVGGKLVSGKRQGKLAAELGVRILRGADPANLPVITPGAANTYRFDYRELVRFGIPLSALPPGSEVIHRPPSFYPISERQLRLALGMLALLCLTLLLGIIDRIRAGRELRRSRAEKTLILDSTSDLILYFDGSQRILWANRAVSRLLGLPPKELPGRLCHELWHFRSTPCAGCPVIRARRSGQPEEAEITTPIGQVWRVRAFPAFDHRHHLIGVVEIATDITDRKRAEQYLQETRARLVSVLQTLPDLVWLKDTQGAYLACNPVFERFFGAAEAEIVGKTDHDFVDRELADSFRQKDREAIAAGHVRINEEWITFADDGHRALLETRKMPVRDADGQIIGVLGIGRDITERKLAEEALRASEERYRALVDNINVGIYRSTGGDGRYLQVNPAMVKIFGFDSMDELLQIPVVALYQNPQDRVDFIDAIETHGAVRDRILPLRRRDGTPIWCSCSATSQYDETGRFKWMEGIIEDVTERYLALDRLEQANRDLEAFAHTVSHDLRTPLTAIIGFTDLLQQAEGAKLTPQSQEFLEIIGRQGERMLALVNDLLELAKAGRIERPEAPIAVAPVLEVSLERLAAREQTEIVCHIPAGLEVALSATVLTQIFDNLIGNALNYAGADGQPIEIDIRRERDRLRLQVRDHGPGIPAEERPRIFDAFYRGRGTRHLPGTGIGLATVAKLARTFHGRAWVEETPGGGCTFIVELRLDTPPAD